MSHVTHVNKSCNTYKWVVSHIWISHVTHMYGLCHEQSRKKVLLFSTVEWFMSHNGLATSKICMSHVARNDQKRRAAVLDGWMSHVTHMDESCHACREVKSRMWMSQITHMYKSCHTCEWVMSHLWMSQVTLVNESCCTYELVTSRMAMGHVTHQRGTSLETKLIPRQIDEQINEKIHHKMLNQPKKLISSVGGYFIVLFICPSIYLFIHKSYIWFPILLSICFSLRLFLTLLPSLSPAFFPSFTPFLKSSLPPSPSPFSLPLSIHSHPPSLSLALFLPSFFQQFYTSNQFIFVCAMCVRARARACLRTRVSNNVYK